MESHTDHKGSTFDMFLLLKKYRNNPGFNLTLDLAIDSKELHFMVLFMRIHNTHAQTQMHKLCNTHQHKQDTTQHETKAQQTTNNLEPYVDLGFKPKEMEMKTYLIQLESNVGLPKLKQRN